MILAACSRHADQLPECVASGIPVMPGYPVLEIDVGLTTNNVAERVTEVVMHRAVRTAARGRERCR